MERGQVAVVIVGFCEHVEQPVHHGEVVLTRGLQRLLYLVITWDERGIVTTHQALDFGGRLRLPAAARVQPVVPRVVLRIRFPPLLDASRGRLHAEGVGEVSRATLHPGEQIIDQRFVLCFVVEEPQFGAHTGKPAAFEQRREALE